MLFKLLSAIVSCLLVVYLIRLATLSKPKLIIHKGNQTKTILYWTDFMNVESFVFGTGHAPFEETGCKVSDCVFWNMQDGEPESLPFQEFDAVLFHGVSTTSILGLKFSGRPPTRLPHQRYIFFAQEPPAKLGTDLTHLTNFFNWTFTYRRDSDIWHPYGWFIDISNPKYNLHLKRKIPSWYDPIIPNLTIQNVVTNKSKMAAWFVSNCATESRREWYVAELAQYIDIDVYGYCGTYYCNTVDCDAMMERDYKFYLAFENSLCVDYVTEKFFRTLRYNIVPIVYGSAAYEEIAPPLSYIDIKDFKNPAHLAEYLIYLDKNPSEYQKFFWWKTHYMSQRTYRESICHLCEILHNPTLPRKVYQDIESWWNKCQSPTKHFLESEVKGSSWIIGDKGRYAFAFSKRF